MSRISNLVLLHQAKQSKATSNDLQSLLKCSEIEFRFKSELKRF